MKNFSKFLLVALATSLSSCNGGGSSNATAAAKGVWTWIGGSNQSGAYGIYGTLGTPSTTNIPGGRDISVSWVDHNGDFWLFGGSGNATSTNGNLNDLWRYNPTSRQWAWMGGSDTPNALGMYGTLSTPTSSNIPGSRLGAVSMTDSKNNLWLFGGFGNAISPIPGSLNDLWEYNTSTKEWTWVSGANTTNASGVYGIKNVPDSSNMPGARLGMVSWVDSNGNFWIFGGAEDISILKVHNDLWKYNPTQNQWVWVSGQNTINQPGIYGVQGMSNAQNAPGSRLDSISWVDKDGNLWLFGGSGIDAEGIRGNLNDLWKYNPTNNQWTWMSGSNQRNKYGVYGTLGISTQNTIPGAREHRAPISWVDNAGNMWMFGGDGNGASTSGILNDLWKYTPSNNQWTWMSGSTETNAFGIYSQPGIPSTNTPGARKDAIGFIDRNKNLWIFGGDGNGVSSNGDLNDLWKYSVLNNSF